jgi:hypothetical protein
MEFTKKDAENLKIIDSLKHDLMTAKNDCTRQKQSAIQLEKESNNFEVELQI